MINLFQCSGVTKASVSNLDTDPTLSTVLGVPGVPGVTVHEPVAGA